MRSKEVFGPDADEFRYERWLTRDEVQKRSLEEAWVVFGRGSRGCIGKEIALLLASLVVKEVCPFSLPVLITPNSVLPLQVVEVSL